MLLFFAIKGYYERRYMLLSAYQTTQRHIPSFSSSSHSPPPAPPLPPTPPPVLQSVVPLAYNKIFQHSRRPLTTACMFFYSHHI